MTEEERRIITAFVERISGAAPVAGPPSGPWGAAAPAQRPNLPPVDPEADRLIAELFARHPEARYRMTQTAFVQEAALVEAQNRIQQLEWELENARRQAQAAQAGGGGFFGGLFGGRSGAPMPPPMPPRPQPVYPAGYNPAALQQQARGGTGFLGTAAAAAAGVAGGMLLGNLLMSAFGGGTAEAAGLGAGDAAPVSSPWTDPAAAGGWGGEKAAAEPAAATEDAWAAADDGDWGGDEEI